MSRCPVDEACRSRMNIPFRVGKNGGDEGLEKKFLEGAAKLGMISLRGHRLDIDERKLNFVVLMAELLQCHEFPHNVWALNCCASKIMQK